MLEDEIVKEESAEELLFRINDCLVNFQNIIKCSICMSTLNEPIPSLCNHIFCKACLEGVFQRRSSIECPICRQVIKKRSVRAISVNISDIVKAYLNVVACFKGEIKDANPIPKEKFILESQAMTQVCQPSTIVLNAGVVARNKRKHEAEEFNLNKLPKIEECRDVFAVPNVVIRQIRESPENNKMKAISPVSTPPSATLSGRKSPTKVKISKSTAAIARKLGFSVSEESIKEYKPPDYIVTPVKKIDDSDVPKRTPSPVASKKKPPVPPRRITSVDKKEGTNVITYPGAVQCDLFPSNLDDAVARRKCEDPHCDDVKAFFSIFPTARRLLKNNLPRLLRELGMRPLVDANITCAPQTVKWEIPIDEDGNYQSDLDTTIPMVNHSITSPVLPTWDTPQPRRFSQKVGNNVECQTDFSPSTQQEEIGTGGQQFVKDQRTVFESSLSITSSSHTRPSPSTSTTAVPDTDIASPLKHSVYQLSKEALAVGDYKPPEKYVLSFSRRESEADHAVIIKFAKLFKIKVIMEISEETTHLVMMNAIRCDIEKKSISFVEAFIRRVEIVSRGWLEESIRSNKLLDSKLYRMHGQSLGPWFATKTGATSPHLFNFFANCYFYLPAKFFPNNIVPRAQVAKIIRLCGGNIVETIFEFDSINYDESKENKPKLEDLKNRLCVFSPYCRHLVEDARNLSKDLRCTVINAEYIFDCVCHYSRLGMYEYIIG